VNGAVDVLEVLRRANPVPPGSIDAGEVPSAARMLALTRVDQDVELDPPDRRPFHERRRWPRYAAAVAGLAAGVAALSLVPRDEADPVATTPPPSPFVGMWVSTDSDGSIQTMEISPAGEGQFDLLVLDDHATVCAGVTSTMTGTGEVQPDGSLLVAQPVFVCDDASTPTIVGGGSVEERLTGLTFVHDDATDELTDSLGVVWWRPESDSGASGGMWPQGSADEVRAAQELADQGDPTVAWQVDPELAGEGDVEGAEILVRFVAEHFGWERYHLAAIEGIGEGVYDGIVLIRCQPGGANRLYPDHPEVGDCAPAVDDRRYEAVRIDLRQPAQQGPAGLWVVTRWSALPFLQSVPPTDQEANAQLAEFLAARVAGEGADAPIEVLVPLLYATSSGAPFERFEIVGLGGPEWPGGDRAATVRLFADGGATVVEQVFWLRPDGAGGLRLDYLDGEVGQSTENGQVVAQPYAFRDGAITFGAAPPWRYSFAGWHHGPAMTTLLLDGAYEEGIAVLTEARTVSHQCSPDPAPADASDLAARLGADADLAPTEPAAGTVAGRGALTMDVGIAPGAVECEEPGTPVLLTPTGAGPDDWQELRLAPGQRMRLFVLDVPDEPGRILVVAVFAPEARFDQVLAAAAPIVESLELHRR
jgi:hypothetical protein